MEEEKGVVAVAVKEEEEEMKDVGVPSIVLKKTKRMKKDS